MAESRLFIGNLPVGTTENDLKNLLKRFQILDVELKRKNNLDQETVFAYANIPKKQTNQCLKELNGYEWKRQRLNVQVAKESFLDRLKKERLQRDETITNQKTLSPCILNNHSPKNKKVFFDTNEEFDDEKIEEFAPESSRNCSLEDESSIPRKRNLPMFQGISKIQYDEEQPKVESQVSSRDTILVEQVCKDDVDITMKKFEDFSSVWRNVSTANSFQYGNTDVYERSISEKKSDRIQKKWEVSELDEVGKEETCKSEKGSRYSAEMKRRTALEDKWNTIKERKSLIRNALRNITSKDAETTHENRNNMTPLNDNSSVKNTFEPNVAVNQTNMTLFNNDSSEEDTFEPNFEVKSYLDGDKGLKRLNLKAKLANDERFRIDERFFDADGNETLENGKTKFGLMKRYEPSSLQTQAAQMELKEKKVKKKTNKDRIEQSTKQKEVPKPEVSKEKHYSVSVNLKDAFKKSDEKTSFSLSALFDTQSEENKQISIGKQNDSIVPPKKIKYVENPLEDPVSSNTEDDDEENEAPIEVLPLTVPSENVLGKCGVWGEAFFFKPNDSRLKEAVRFYESSESRGSKDFGKRRKQLRSIVKKKIQNSRRDKKVFRRKLGGKINRTKFKIRLKKINSNH